MRPGVLECGCLWDGNMLSIEPGCTLPDDDHGLGRVPYIRRRLSIGGVSLDQTEWPAAGRPTDSRDWPDPDGRWISEDHDG